jgi:hypothetical protein
MKKIPGDKDWEGEFESYPDITLSATGTSED